MQNYRYNLVLFKEIKRFWNYREQLGMFATVTNLVGNILFLLAFLCQWQADGETLWLHPCIVWR